MRKLLANRDTRIYLFGQSCSVLGDASLWLALGIWVKELTHSNAAAGLTFFFLAAASLLSPLAGMLVDRVRRRPTLIVVNFVAAAGVLLLLLVHSSSQVWLVYLVMFGYGLVGCVIGSAQSAFLTVLVPPDLLGDANAFLRTVREGLRLVAPLIGAGLFVVVGGHVIAVLDSATFVIAGVSVLVLHLRETVTRKAPEHFLDEVLGGFRHVFRTPVLRRCVIALSLACCVIGFAETAIFAVVQYELHRPASFIGVLMAIQGVGALVGGPVSSPLMRRTGERWLSAIGLVGCAAGSVLLVSGHLALILFGMAVFGASLPPLLVGAYTLMQRRTPEELQGRTFSAFDLVATLPQTISIGVGAAIISVIGYRSELLVMGAVVALSGVLLALPVRGEPNFGERTEPADEGEPAELAA